jgi:hypothetical protein
MASKTEILFDSNPVDRHSLFNALRQPLHRYLIALLIIYLLTVRVLRNARLRATIKAFPYPTRRSFSSMTVEDAYRIQQTVAELEFPTIFQKALEFALFRTYGIPSISSLLVTTSQLVSPATGPKRYVDTTVLIKEFMGHPPTSQRSLEAIGRMNYLHSYYQRSGRISNDDMLYTLALFALEPIRWINRYEWRQLSDLEKCATGTFWKSIGDAMGISYDPLVAQSSNDPDHHSTSKNPFIDGLHWLDQLANWAEAYEQRTMIFNPNNHHLANETTRLLLWVVPAPLKPAGKAIVSALMDNRLRSAMMYSAPPEFLLTLVPALLRTRAFVLRHFALPRPYFLRFHSPSRYPIRGRYTLSHYDNEPYYVPATFWYRWSPSAWLLRLMGLPVPGDGGDRFSPQGYQISSVGPRGFGKGVLEVKEEKRHGCPFG